MRLRIPITAFHIGQDAFEGVRALEDIAPIIDVAECNLLLATAVQDGFLHGGQVGWVQAFQAQAFQLRLAGAAAACGGVTTVFEMPNTNPPTGTLAALALKLKAAESSYVDYGIHGLLGDDTIANLEQLLDAGVVCTVGTDDPISFGNSIEDEYEFLAGELGFSEKDLERVAANGFQVALKKN